MKKKNLQQAIEQEARRFQECYDWLEKNMPPVFFEEVDSEWILLIAHALMGFKVQGYTAQIHVKNGAIALCLDTPDADLHILKNYAMHGIKNYMSYLSEGEFSLAEKSSRLRIATLYFTEAGNEKGIATRFLRTLPEDRRADAKELFHRAEEYDDCQVKIYRQEAWKEKGSSSLYILLAWKNSPKHLFLYRLARLIQRHGLRMRRVNAAYIDPYSTKGILMLSFGLHGINGAAAWDACDLADFLQELVTLKYFASFDAIDSTFIETGLIRGNMGNFLRSLMNFIHQILVNVDPYLFSLENIEEDLCRHPEITLLLCQAFEAKFHPEKHNLEQFTNLRTEFIHLVTHLDTGNEQHDSRRKQILLQGMNFIHHILKTNFYCSHKTALAFRVDPHYLDNAPFDRKQLFPLLPFGIFFIKGMHFVAFHIRFKDLSRGGLRTIFPDEREKMLVERNTVFGECYNLAYTQHKKNKDIPEGGAKGVIFLKPNEQLNVEVEILINELSQAGSAPDEVGLQVEHFKKEQKIEYLYQTQRSFITNFLTLINCDEKGSLREKQIVDYWKKPEYIYLGPDENMHDIMIEWIAAKSIQVHYKPGGAFISGKPTVGINHKEYGVTSLGVNVYMHEVLKHLGIDPTRDPFTVKMTGGPDGDVAGNQIHNLYRYYPKTAKLLALVDVSGVIYDPNGLDLETCVSLFHKGQSIRFFPPERLSIGGFLIDKTQRRHEISHPPETLCWENRDGSAKEKWILTNEANSIYSHTVHKTKADVFIPCGGRPRTLNESNYTDFLDENGTPTSKAIIEGANLYLSTQARHALEEKGVLIVKDSSANKCGVICSSFEILCGLALSDEEFLKNKKMLVAEILKRLEKCAIDEASLLLNTHRYTKKRLTDISDEISTKILFFRDQLLNHLDHGHSLSSDPKDPFIRCFLTYCLVFLRTHFEKQLIDAIPDNHKKAIIASYIASRLVYEKGLEWSPTLPDVLPLLLEEFSTYS